MGSNMAECHPVAFRWPMKAKVNGAKLIHVDPRFTRTSAMCDIHAPIRAGSDIAFLGGLINYVLNSQRWNTDPFFHEYVANYTNAATLINPDFKDTEDLGGVFSGLMQYTEHPEWPYNGFMGQYDPATWQYASTQIGDQGRVAATAQSGEQRVPSGHQGQPRGGQASTPNAPGAAAQGTTRVGPPFDPLVKSLLKPPPRTDPTLQDP
jgi:formate dehydrogenase major subunit